MLMASNIRDDFGLVHLIAAWRAGAPESARWTPFPLAAPQSRLGDATYLSARNRGCPCRGGGPRLSVTVVNDPTDIRFDLAGDQLRARISGRFDVRIAKSDLGRVVKETHQRGVEKVLIDIRELEGDITILERFMLVEELATLTRGDVAVAIVDSPDRVWPDRFFETVAANRGARVKVVTDLVDAVTWLDLTVPPKSP
jgi:hypothetical protein